ncbi:MAG: methyltransferase [Acidimicrobiales bacterium]
MSAVSHDPPLLDHPGGRLRAWQALGRAIAAVPAWPEAIGGTPPVPRQVTKKPVTSKPGATGFDLLVHLFVGHDAVDARAFAERIRPAKVAELEAGGLLERSGTEVVSKFGIERWGGVAVLHDWPEWRDAAGYVMGLTNSGRSLAWFSPRVRTGRVLDLGTGCGVQAVCAASHAETVVAVDVNPRAVVMTEASAALCGTDRVEAREGSWFEPVEGESFDLVVTNPPFVISPENRLVYRDGGRQADELCGALLADLPEVMALGGRAVMLVEWARRSGEEWSTTPLKWLAPPATDGIVVRYGDSTPLEYATRWNQMVAPDPVSLRRTVRTWMAEYERLGLEHMYEGVICLRRPQRPAGDSSDSWAIIADRFLDGPGGDQLADVLDGHVTTEGAEPEALADLCVHPVAGHRFDQELTFDGDEYVLGRIGGGFPTGAGIDVAVTPTELQFLLTLEPGASLGDAMDRKDGDDLERHEVFDLVARLVRAGLVRLTSSAS